MNSIKFSHIYPKLWGQETAELIAVRELNIPDDLNDELIAYDTYYKLKSANDGNVYASYPLPKGKCLQLIFLGGKHIPFCTIRRWSLKKEIYYKGLIGRTFEIRIAEV
jgi:hypothetical protein